MIVQSTKSDSRNGALLISIVVTLTILAALGAAVVTTTSTAMRSRVSVNDSHNAYYLAESGGEYAQSLLRDDPLAEPSGVFSLDDGTSFTLSSQDDPNDPVNRLLVTSVGEVGNARRRVRFSFAKYPGSGGGQWEGDGRDFSEEDWLEEDPEDITYDRVEEDGDLALLVESLRSAEGFFWTPLIRDSIIFPDACDFLTDSWEQESNYMSFDTQVKMKTEYIGTRVSYMAGISVRLEDDGRGYGVSFARADDTSIDGIPQEFIPNECKLRFFGICILYGDINDPMVVLWQNAGSTSGDKNWLAYRLLGSYDLLSPGTDKVKDWATLMVRIREVPSIYYTSASFDFKNGDIVTQGTNTATVYGAPLLPFNGASEGALMLENKVGVFSGGSFDVNGTNAATITEYRERDNFIWVLVGDTSGGTPDSDAYNVPRNGYARSGDYVYAPWDIGDWTISNDYFTVVSWEDSQLCDLLGPEGNPGTVIRSDEFTTSDSSPHCPQVGLHTFGWNNVDYDFLGLYKKNYFFDDFGVAVREWEAESEGYQY